MSFAPVFGPGSRALILGSWPSPKSWDMGFYYGHPHNRFWPLLARLTGEPAATIRTRLHRIRRQLQQALKEE